MKNRLKILWILTVAILLFSVISKGPAADISAILGIGCAVALAVYSARIKKKEDSDAKKW